MSIRSDRLAFISLGNFCQPAHRIRAFAQGISSVTGEEFDLWPSFFDYLATPNATLCKLLDEFALPQSPDELIVKSKAAFWEAGQLFFPHHFRAPGPDGHHQDTDITGTWNTYIPILRRLGEDWQELEDSADRIGFVISNAQWA